MSATPVVVLSPTAARRLAKLPARVRARIVIIPNGCWIWQPTAPSVQKYGQLDHRRAHRVVWELLGGAHTPGKVLDHTCAEKWCVNPAHLQEVSIEENTKRTPLRIAKAVSPICPRCGTYYVFEPDPRGRMRKYCPACNRKNALASYYRRRDAGRL